MPAGLVLFPLFLAAVITNAAAAQSLSAKKEIIPATSERVQNPNAQKENAPALQEEQIPVTQERTQNPARNEKENDNPVSVPATSDKTKNPK